MHDISVDTEVKRLCSSESQQAESGDVEVEWICSSDTVTQCTMSSDTMTEIVSIGADLLVMQTCIGADSLMIQPFMPWPVVQTVAQQGQLSLCDKVMTVVGDLDLDKPVIESFTYMLMPVVADAASELVCASDTEDSRLTDTLGVHAICEGHGGLVESETVVCQVDLPEVEDCREWILESDLTEVVSLAEISIVASAFGTLMCDILVSRPEVAFAIGAFSVDIVSRTMAETGMEHRGDLQDIVRYLQICAAQRWSM